MNKSQPNSPRARLQALRAIPEKDRTDAEWDEMNELEIMLAAENRHPGPGQGQGQGQGQRPKGIAPAPHNKGPVGAHGNQPQRKFHKRPRRRKGGPGQGPGPGPNG
ncbi:MAG TPA: hypothetical protein VFB75_22745 [Burkholderiales bacterium]|nr:hypothetical protein [Burkholderiales bacterium]